MPAKPLCFVLMPFGEKPDPAGGPAIDFNRIYQHALEPAIQAAGMIPIRADEERTGGIIHKPMFERLLLCEYALADLTTANANVFYELGVRHTARPSTTLPIFATHQPIPFDVNFLRALPYELGPNNTFAEAEAAALRKSVTARLSELREEVQKAAVIDSPLFQLLSEWKPGELAHSKTDVFREQVQYSETIKQRLATARITGKHDRQQAVAELAAVRAELGELDGVDAGVAIDLMLSHRAVEDWNGVEAIYDDMPNALKRQIMIREQLAFAINRRAGTRSDPGKRDAERARALQILIEVEAQQGAGSETCGLLGRIHKDRWSDALTNDPLTAGGHLDQAIAAYVRGFKADTRDAYPGINAITLLDIKGDEASLKEKKRLLPVVRFAVEQRLAGKTPDYWDYATMLELAVLNDDPTEAMNYLAKALAVVRESWEPKTTANNLRMIQQVRVERGAEADWLEPIIDRLEP